MDVPQVDFQNRGISKKGIKREVRIDENMVVESTIKSELIYGNLIGILRQETSRGSLPLVVRLMNQVLLEVSHPNIGWTNTIWFLRYDEIRLI